MMNNRWKAAMMTMVLGVSALAGYGPGSLQAQAETEAPDESGMEALSEAEEEMSDEERAAEVASLIDAIYVQERT